MIMNNLIAVLLAGGEGTRLYPLTRDRAKPAVPFGGIYRIIDFTLSNCINSDVKRILVLTQYKSLSLARHIRIGWQHLMHPDFNEFIEIIPPQKRVSENWYLGTADAVFQNLYSIQNENPRDVIILSGDHIYKMDYRKMYMYHRSKNADLTVGTFQVPREQGNRFGVMEIDPDFRIISFEEKPLQPKTVPGNPRSALVSMGVYIFRLPVLVDILRRDAQLATSRHDFGKDIIVRMLDRYQVYAYNFVDENKHEATYWRDIGTLDAYWEANMDLVFISPVFNLYDKDWPINTVQQPLPPAKFVFAQEKKRFGAAIDSMVSHGCIISGGQVVDSVLSQNVRVNSYSRVEQSILFQGVDVGRYCRIRKAIIEKNTKIPPHTVIGYDVDEDRKRFFISEGGVTVVLPDNFEHAQSVESPLLPGGEEEYPTPVSQFCPAPVDPLTKATEGEEKQ